MNMDIQIKEELNQTLVVLEGEIDAYTAPKVKEKVAPLLEGFTGELVFDLSNVNYMDSTGLGMFVGFFKTVKANNGVFRLVGLSDRLKRLFDITGLAGIMEIK
ncbi:MULTISPECIES: STAS domain-containing protein [Bacillaceae]|uniref:Anti-sigma factor antagonist n=1 Tax=Sutcliffiella horikoshii TaxID=79883 RepID=A0A5D4SJ11_9BACI|nr:MULTISPECIES: STAS domain-containing protein [Bacillaceae]KPB04133.1 anti-sigma B factor antagonist [Bacillus sp. CHD6a]TYS63425.1 STAS domain-containing protein [Sutcliffiella horikoshii]